MNKLKNISISQVKVLTKMHISAVVEWLLPHGSREGKEWIALNPTRSDKKSGSFKINIQTGKWADFATGDKGGDVISLVAYIKSIKQIEAAKIILQFLKG